MNMGWDQNAYIRKQYDYHIWANERVFNHLKGLPNSILHKDVQSVFPSLSTVLAHVTLTETIWLKVMCGAKFEAIDEYVNRSKWTQTYAEKNIQDIEDIYRQIELDYQKFLEEDSNITKELDIDHPKFGNINIPAYELIQHLINHASYHRGNTTAILRQLGCKGISTDYFVYVIQTDQLS